ncbi:MAG TPA: electron-transfer flavoprotein:ubiquinone oxidoreductase [Longimicrobiales bacterium]|nr:electron-transfer flavoprotein:ubiquinone oxidoreductase [Longimicrobiales bacterium]
MSDDLQPAGPFRPVDHQPPLPRERLIVEEAPDEEAVPLDVVFVGGGPAGLAGAIELARLAREDGGAGGELGDLEIGVMEKAAELGEHCLSGAVVDPRAFEELFPGIDPSDFPLRGPVEKEAVYLLTGSRAIRIPTPPTMKNHGNRVASICEIVRWLGDRAEEVGVNLFPGFPVDSLLVEGDRVTGVRTTPSGLDRDGSAVGGDYMPAMDLSARVTVLSEGTRGTLTQAWLEWQGVGAENPQIYALGVKELWETKRPLDRVIHTLGWPLPTDAFGGSFMYPMGENLVALGLVVGLDYRDARLDVHQLLQEIKLHPLFRPRLEGGEMVEWGGKTIPEGGWWSLPERRHGGGCVVVGDAAGYVDVPSLKGIHYAMHSGILAARAIFRALKADDVSEAGLRSYTESVDESYIADDLYRTRNMRLAFKDGFWAGGAKATVMTLTGGAFPGGRPEIPEDAAEERELGPDSPGFRPDGTLTFSKVDAVFKSGNTTRDDIPSHLVVGRDVPAEVAELYVHMCPAGVYEREGEKLVVNAPNCIDCKATDVLGPRWTPREGGSGPGYRRM